MTTYNLGRVLPKFCGSYSPTTPYETLDIVYYNGSSYVCNVDDIVNVTPDSSTCWILVARKGAETEVTEEQINSIKQQCLNYLQSAGAVFDSEYVHTSNNFTDAYESKLNGIESGAQVNVQSDWNQTDTTADDYIKNKPNITPSDNNFTDAYKSKLDSIDATAQPNVQSDWTETDVNSDSYIQNKPQLADVATSGSYNSLSNRPTLFDGDYYSLSNRPTIPSRMSQLVNDEAIVVYPTTYDMGAQTNVVIDSLNGNEKYFCSNLLSLTISSFGENTHLPSWIYFEDVPDSSLILTMPASTKWVTETPLFYASEYATEYCIRVEDGIAQLLVLAREDSSYTNQTEDHARWSAATWHDDPENWQNYIGIEPAEPLF